MTKHHYNIKLDIPLDADSARYFIPEGYTARIEDGVLIIEPKEIEGERILNELLATFEAMGNDYWHEIDCGDIIAYLKSIKNKRNFPKSNTNSPSWKPSASQLMALDGVKRRMSLEGYGLCPDLQSLLDDLKKLM